MKTILIRAEDKNEWEKRTPLIPDDLKTVLSETGGKAFVERSGKRFFKEEAYRKAGAEITEGMAGGDIILGVKEIPEEKILDNKIYLFFSHTIKGQAGNMPMLKRIMNSGSTLIDYEKIIDEKGRRQVYFGRYAGDAGAIDILWLMGEYWRHKDINSPLHKVEQALKYHSVEEAKDHLERIGDQIKEKGWPPEISPVVIGILGYGNVSKGAQNIFNALPTEYIKPDALPALIENGEAKNDRIYLVVFEERHLVKPKEGHPFNLNDYYIHPEKYEAAFEPYLPYLTIIVNATYWDERYPRFVTWKGLRLLQERFPQPKLAGIADITCDVNGSIECNVKTTDSGQPAYRVDPKKRTVKDGHLGDGIVLLAVDNLPAELPNDASVFFSNQLRPYVPNLMKALWHKRLEDSGLHPHIKPGVIVYNGQLTEPYYYLQRYL